MSTATLIIAEQLAEMPATVSRPASDIGTLALGAELDGEEARP